ncbi:Acyl-CoA wax alcohol acyltransferase 1 [Fukomys damarensis]|uniref:Acyltransferase n=1 Tax=Fukomys damarensis TaxID=885580 RepID=A0A091E461_FUKDA|nr:Acyl-CoA wax alcohol acyltransferase 1 [Fukomys damarensis]
MGGCQLFIVICIHYRVSFQKLVAPSLEHCSEIFASFRFQGIMPSSKQPNNFQILSLLQWPLSYLAICGRRSAWVRNWYVWTHIRDYFPIMILKTEDLSPERNYIMGVHPHGLLTFGAFCNFCTEATGFSKTFPGITPHLATLSWFFKVPLIRDYLMAKGVCSVSQPAINYLLSHGTGNLVGIVVGGVGEALQSVPNTTTLILQKRKGFVRTALQHGAHLVPTFTFGETEVFDQVLFQEGSRMYKCQNFFRRIFGFYFCVFYGQGFYQGSIGPLPYSRPIVTVVGEPLPLPQIEKPSQEMVDKYHTLYMDALSKLFNKHKTQYGCSDSQKLLFL